MEMLDQIASLYTSELANQFYAEDVTEANHACQTAELATASDSAKELVSAAFLHDIGHLLVGEYSTKETLDQDFQHEVVGCEFLKQHFDNSVVEPIRLHVEAKRYLCATDTDYLDNLSPASKRSLEVQGGVMSKDEASEFEKLPHASESIKLRKWDDQAKVPNARPASVQHWINLIGTL